MYIASIDGACTRNGMPDSVGCGACAVINVSEECSFTPSDIYYGSVLEEFSTNQRAELHGLLLVLDFMEAHPDDYIVVTDSEYIYNAITRDWIHNWMCNSWLTSTLEPVKNKDLWKAIYEKLCAINSLCTDSPCFYHVKGHILSFGKVLRNTLLNDDPSGFSLLEQILQKFDGTFDPEDAKVAKALQCFEKNNAFVPSERELRRLVSMNIFVDCLASYSLERYLLSTQEEAQKNKSGIDLSYTLLP